jgi:hypothetical protein
MTPLHTNSRTRGGSHTAGVKAERQSIRCDYNAPGGVGVINFIVLRRGGFIFKCPFHD